MCHFDLLKFELRSTRHSRTPPIEVAQSFWSDMLQVFGGRGNVRIWVIVVHCLVSFAELLG